MYPDSFSTICTQSCKQELIGFLLSLSIHHKNARVYVICDTATKQYIDNSTPKIMLDICWKVDLDKYSNMNRQEMERAGVWSDFQMAKADVITFALENSKDTLFLDSDTIILDTLELPSNTKQLGVSPQFIKKKDTDRTGYYNGGMLWTNQKSLPENWKKFTKTSRYYDQASIEDLTEIYDYFEFGDNYNLQTWRFMYGIEPSNVIASNIQVQCNTIKYKSNNLKFIHTHFNHRLFQQINQFFIQKLREARRWKELLIIYRVIHDKWILKIPKQPQSGKYSHKNDSFREMPILLKQYNNDIDIEFVSNTGHCWIEPNILLYDRPTLSQVNEEVAESSLILLGNGDMNVEGKQLRKFCSHVAPWIFWPRRPMILENVLKKRGILSWEQREITSIFIGNYENNVQKHFRDTNENWEEVLTEYHCTKGHKHLFTNEEYLMKLRSSKFGLCIRGFGTKCHREVELMAFGTVPIITKDVSISSYYDPPVENVHYIRANNKDELRNKVNSIDQEKWQQMSNACYQWYQRNVLSKNCWNTMIQTILYEMN